jgi:hypothetical protein
MFGVYLYQPRQLHGPAASIAWGGVGYMHRGSGSWHMPSKGAMLRQIFRTRYGLGACTIRH